MTSDVFHLGLMAPISLSEMDSVHLMNRTDTKYLTDIVTLGLVLEDAARSGYMVFENDGLRIMEYRSMYYDTPDLRMYLDHHNRRLTRQKLRIRCYVDSDLTFLELKSKDNHSRTRKKRIEVSPEFYGTALCSDAEAAAWLEGRTSFETDRLSPALETCFSRITLVDPAKTERSTIDLDLNFRNVRKGTSAGMGDLAVIEVKQDGCRQSVIRDILLERRVKPISISKYCIGTAMTDTSVKCGRFKEKMLLIKKMSVNYDSVI